MEKIICIIPSWNEISEAAEKTADKIKSSDYVPDVIIGISRGGLVPSRLIADHLHIKEIVTLKADHWGITATKDGRARISHGLNMDLTGKKVLLVDDITDTGHSIEVSRKHIKEKNPADVKTATLYYLTNSRHIPDFYGHEREWAWMIFPWNYREDLVNLSRKLMKEGIENPEGIKEGLHQNFNIDLESDEVKKVLEHIKYLESVGK